MNFQRIHRGGSRPGLAYTVIFGYSYTNIHYCIHIHIRISIYSVYNIQTAWCQVLRACSSHFLIWASFYHACARTHTSVYFRPILLLHDYTLHATLQNILYTTYMPALRMAPYGMAAVAAITTFNYSSYSCCGQAGRAIQYSCRAE